MDYITSTSTPFEVFKAFFAGIDKNFHMSEEIKKLFAAGNNVLISKSHAVKAEADTPQERTVFCCAVTLESIKAPFGVKFSIIRVLGETENYVVYDGGIPTLVTEKTQPSDFIANQIASEIRDVTKLMCVMRAASEQKA